MRCLGRCVRSVCRCKHQFYIWLGVCAFPRQYITIHQREGLKNVIKKKKLEAKYGERLPFQNYYRKKSRQRRIVCGIKPKTLILKKDRMFRSVFLFSREKSWKRFILKVCIYFSTCVFHYRNYQVFTNGYLLLGAYFGKKPQSSYNCYLMLK